MKSHKEMISEELHIVGSLSSGCGCWKVCSATKNQRRFGCSRSWDQRCPDQLSKSPDTRTNAGWGQSVDLFVCALWCLQLLISIFKCLRTDQQGERSRSFNQRSIHDNGGKRQSASRVISLWTCSQWLTGVECVRVNAALFLFCSGTDLCICTFKDRPESSWTVRIHPFIFMMLEVIFSSCSWCDGWFVCLLLKEPLIKLRRSLQTAWWKRLRLHRPPRLSPRVELQSQCTTSRTPLHPRCLSWPTRNLTSSQG